jgi:HK97 family phage prohead protease
MKTLTEFGERLTTLRDGRQGLRGALHCEVKAGPGEHELDFVATDETLDRYDEVVRLDGWQTANYLANPVVVDSHNYWSVLSILGNTTRLTITDGAMRNRVKFAVDNPAGAISFKMAKAGFIHSESVGFIPMLWENGMREDQPPRTFLKQELLEISLVSVPANPGATVGAALKSGAIVRSDLRELVQLLTRS